MLRRNIWILLLGITVVLSGCLNAGQKEFEEYYELIEKEIINNPELEKEVDEYINLIIQGKPTEAVENMKEYAIPNYEKRKQTFEDLKFNEDDIQEFNEQVLVLIQLSLDKQVELVNVFEDILDNKVTTLDDINAESLEILYQITKILMRR